MRHLKLWIFTGIMSVGLSGISYAQTGSNQSTLTVTNPPQSCSFTVANVTTSATADWQTNEVVSDTAKLVIECIFPPLGVSLVYNSDGIATRNGGGGEVNVGFEHGSGLLATMPGMNIWGWAIPVTPTRFELATRARFVNILNKPVGTYIETATYTLTY